MSKIISIGTAVPQHRTAQPAILEFMQAAYGNDVASRKLNVLFNNSGISARYSVLPDFDKTNQQHIFFNGTPSTANVENRLSVFKERAIPLALSAVKDAFTKLNTTFERLHYFIHYPFITPWIDLSKDGLNKEGDRWI